MRILWNNCQYHRIIVAIIIILWKFFRKIIHFMLFKYFHILTFVSIVLRFTTRKLLHRSCQIWHIGHLGPYCFGRLRVKILKILYILRGFLKINHPWKCGYMKSYRYFSKWFQTTTKTNKPLKYYMKYKTDKYVLFYDRNKHNFACSKWKRTKHSHVTRYICPNIRILHVKDRERSNFFRAF